MQMGGRVLHNDIVFGSQHLAQFDLFIEKRGTFRAIGEVLGGFSIQFRIVLYCIRYPPSMK